MICRECENVCSSDCKCWCHEAERVTASGYESVFLECNRCGREIVWQIEDACGLCKTCMNSERSL